jgi:hypothetical protein
MVFYWRNLAYPRNYEILVSKTGHRWSLLKRNLDARNGTDTLTPTENTKTMKHVVTFPDTVDQYQLIRVRIPKGSDYFAKYDQYDFMQLHEFKLFPKTIPEPPEISRKNNFDTRQSTRKTDRFFFRKMRRWLLSNGNRTYSLDSFLIDD